MRSLREGWRRTALPAGYTRALKVLAARGGVTIPDALADVAGHALLARDDLTDADLAPIRAHLAGADGGRVKA